MESLELFIRDIALKKDSNDPVSIDFFKLIAKNFRRITSNNILQLRLVEEAVVYSIGIVMEFIDPNSSFKKTLDLGLDKYIENEPLIRIREKSTTDMVRIAVVRVAYYIVFLKIALDDELNVQKRTKDIDEYFEYIFNEYISWNKVASDTYFSKEDFLQKLKRVYSQIYRGLPTVYIPANLFMSVSLIDLNDFEEREWRYFANFNNLDKCIKILSSSRLVIEKQRLYEFIDKYMPEMYENFTNSQMNRFISLLQTKKDLYNQFMQLKSQVETYASSESCNTSEDTLSTEKNLQRKLIELQSINISQQKEIANLHQTINELLLVNHNLKQMNDEQKKELDKINQIPNMVPEKPDPLSFYIDNPQKLKKIIEYAESESCSKKIYFYKYIYSDLLDSGMSKDILRSAEFLRALIPHLKHIKGINAGKIARQDVLSLQQTIRINDAKYR